MNSRSRIRLSQSRGGVGRENVFVDRQDGNGLAAAFAHSSEKTRACDGWSIVHECFMAPNYPRNMIDGRLALHCSALLTAGAPMLAVLVPHV